MKTIILVSIWMLLIGVLTPEAQVVKPLSPQEINLGQTIAGDTLHGTILFRVEGAVPVEIRDVETSCGCTVPSLKKRKYAPGDTGRIAFTINTRGFRGHIRKAITVLFNSPDIKPLRFIATAEVKPQVAISPPFINFQTVPFIPDSVFKQKVIFENNTSQIIRITEVKVDNPLLKVVNLPKKIPAGSQVTFYVRFKPTAIGRFPIRITLMTNAARYSRLVIPVLIHVVPKGKVP